jgi:F-type H+-transporting ATPase subunit a
MGDKMDTKVNTVFEIFNIPVTNVVVMSWIAMAVIILWAFLATRKMKPVPSGLQNTAEIVVETVNNFTVGQIGSMGKSFAPYIGTVGLFLIIANTIGALFMDELTNGLIAPPARSLGVPVALAMMTIIIVIAAGIYKKGLFGFIKKLFKPIPILFPFNLLDFITKPLSLSMRLFGNILGAYIIMELLFASFPWAVPSVVSLYFDLFDGLLQAYIFVFLTVLYIAEEVKEEEE